jgi:hypothetical protein
VRIDARAGPWNAAQQLHPYENVLLLCRSLRLRSPCGPRVWSLAGKGNVSEQTLVRVTADAQTALGGIDFTAAGAGAVRVYFMGFG